MEGPCIDELPGLLARKMLTKCGGVPLAIKTLAGLLRSRNGVQQWKQIEASHIWKEDAVTLPASIKLSFKYLPSVALKKCFVFCAIFPEDEIIEKDRLIQLWMAQGFLQHPDDEMEKVGEDHFHVLLNNSLLQDAEFDELGHVISCKMHDAVHNLARTLLRNDVTLEMRHVSLSRSGDVCSPLKNCGDLRTFSVSSIPTKSESINMKMVNNLRVLSLIEVDLEELPDSIGELKHLRYLDISGNSITSLPDGFTRLYNLQTFRSNHWSHGVSFNMLPEGFSKLVKLRHIVDTDNWYAMGIPIGLGMLTCLRTLPTIDASAGWGGRLSELQFLSELEGRLSIKGLEQVEIEEAKKVNLGKKENIEDLRLVWGFNYGEQTETKPRMVAEALQPHSNLASLLIYNYHAKALPQWVTKMMGSDGSPFSNLVCLKIGKCKGLEHMPIPLKNFITLKQLYISNCESVITPPQHLECLVSLEILVVEECPKMENLVADITPLVNLEKVEISYCKNMTSLPTGICSLTSLVSLKIGPFNPELDVFPLPTYNHESPAVLCLYGDQMEKVKSLPNQIQYLSQLTYLDIFDFFSLEALPESLGNLTSLYHLGLRGLPRIKCLPTKAAMGRLSQLTSLSIRYCPLLIEACRM